ncbi:uncharacterized protein SAPINGB_P004586 [Magnusiomyces paraingens]|uniref:Glucosidase II subunit alpha n=1 Tax=Magnusiomyces paraingens TaxID=2606893 RepID=A0A5E8C0S5_9ASCO|nr:uncharacterized protein SAPINGB_P004586 [Saprochaete ingens]VVT55417.1 unnamed protein product [Saprochaete ingens]
MKSRIFPNAFALLGIYFLISIALFSTPSQAVKHNLFRTCEQNKFCKRNRHIADYASSQTLEGKEWTSPYEIDVATVALNKDKTAKLTGNILKTTPKGFVTLPFSLSFLKSGIVRFTLDELKRQDGNIEIPGNKNIRKERYNDLDKWTLIEENLVLSDGTELNIEQVEHDLKISYGGGNKLFLQSNPFSIKFYRNEELQVVLNERGLLNLEHWRAQPPAPKEGEEQVKDSELNVWELEEGMWEDTFDGKTDKKVRGPESIALDISFIGFKHVYGIPEHSDSLSLRETRGQAEGHHKDPYRLFNVDIFEYEVDSPMAMYGSIPFMQAHKAGSSVGLYWNNAADTYVDIIKTRPSNDKMISSLQSTQTHWISESGLIDIFVILADDPSEVNEKYGSLTGYALLPQSFAIGHHQCRWNYNDKSDVLEVNSNFDKYDIPYDVIWLDIEYTDDKKYFTWNEKAFKGHDDMIKELDETKRKLVAIIDPHIKAVKGYKQFETLESKNLAICNTEDKPYHGHCWPGESVWIDTLSPEARKLWVSWFGKDQSWAGNNDNLHIWNDMNEPSVFSGPETTMDKNTVHFGGWEHRDVHNLYGMTYHNATLDALNERYNYKQRPFVLTRAYFAGSQRTAAMWTGDNMAKWEYLKAATPMILTSGVAGMPFAGADVGGFFGNPSTELLTRWYQAGAFYPFFRAHAHIDSKRREPWLAGEPYTSIIKSAIQLRYKLLPTFYSAFYQASIDGSPILKPLYYVTPNNEDSFAIDDEFYVGDSGILVKPVTEEGATSVNLYIPDDEFYYGYDDHEKIYKGVGNYRIEAPLNTIPMLLRGGHIHVRRDRPRRSATLMKYDPYTLVIALDKNGQAKGEMFIDDGESYNYEKGEYLRPEFELDIETGILSGTNEDETVLTPYLKSLWVEKIIIIGANANQIKEGTAEVVEQDEAGEEVKRSVQVKRLSQNSAVIVGPRVKLANDWSIEFK